MIKACLGLLVGVYALHFSSFDRPGLAVFVVILALVVGRAFGRAAALMFAAGFALFALHVGSLVESRLDARFAGDSMLTTVRIVDFPREHGDAVSFVAVPVDDSRVPRRLRLTWYRSTARPGAGDVWQLEVRLRRPRGTSNPGVFDYEAWLARERIGATGYVVNGERNRRVGADGGPSLLQLRSRVVERLFDAVPDAPSAAVLAAITVGARHRISTGQWEDFARSGTSHLMAISGLHVGLAGMACYWLTLLVCAVLRVGGNHHRLALPGSAAMAGAYACVSGAAVPALRATAMLLLLVLVLLRRRQVLPLRVLAAAATVVLLCDPLASLAPGFKLSFAAVGLLVWAAMRRRPARASGRRRRVYGAATGLAAIQVLLLFGLLPLTVTEFQRVAVAAPIVNLFAVPLFSFVTVPLALTGLVLAGPFEFLGDGLLRLSAASVALLGGAIRLVAGLPIADVRTSWLSGAALGLLALSAVPALLPSGWPARRVAWLAAFAVIAYRVDGPPAGCFDVRVLDVGQGLAAVVRTRTRVLLYDTGASFFGGGSMAGRVVLPYLSGQGVRRLDRIVVSHADTDHAGGIHEILDAMPVDSVIGGEPLPLKSRGLSRCRSGQSWRWDGVVFRMLHPEPATQYEGNDASCVLQIAAGDRRYLLTGDIGRNVERGLVRRGAITRHDVVLVSHHGSNTSSDSRFIDAVDATLAIVPAGHGNRWDLPSDEVVARWRSAGVRVLQTATDGAVHTRICPRAGIVALERHRHVGKRIWHEQ